MTTGIRYSITRIVIFSAIALAGNAQTIVHQIPLPNTMYWCEDSMINTLFSEIN